MEQVFGVPTEALVEALGPVEGFRASRESLTEVGIRLEQLGEFRPRDTVEDDPTFQQLIPYVALTHTGRVLVLERLEGGGERRLHGRVSIGVGGHVNPEPPGPEPLVVRGLRREVDEEVRLDGARTSEPELLGFIRDTSNEVGRVHFGLACRVEVSAPVEIRETDHLRGHWVPVEELPPFHERMETWSRFLAPVIAERSLATGE